MFSLIRERNHQNDRPGAAYLTRASEVLGHAKVQHEELLLKIEVCAEELREYLGKSAVWGPKELFELNWLRQQRPMHFLCWRQCFLNCSSLFGVTHLKGQPRFYRKHDRRFLRGGRFSHQVWPTMGHCKAEILEFGAPGAATTIWHLGGQDQGKPRRLD